MRRAARYLAISSKKSLCALKKNESAARIHPRQAAAHAPFDVFDAVAQGEGQFLNRGRSRFANVIAADGDGLNFGVCCTPNSNVSITRRIDGSGG